MDMAVVSTPLSDLDIARSIPLQPIRDVAERLGVYDDELGTYGRYIAKIDAPAILDRLRDRPNGKYIDVTGITPTPLGEGKSLTTVGLSMALNHVGKRAIGTIRQPSMGPLFGIKGGAAGGGYSQVLPMESFNLHLTGDTHAVAMAHNLLAAAVDNHLMHGNELDIDSVSVTWPRVVDLNDRALRYVVVGLGKGNGVPRETRFDVTIREVRAYTGAGFLTPISGEIMTMPGLPTNAAYHTIDLDEGGAIVGLF
jgi:formate--tetrahydrofolate ligase